ncbi:unnamed protein product [Oppiella nova]|uniref:tRNA pseudouridine synthase n=1 Tax=Oppiella nova TaxID=334625 RepID=A0A7R9L9B7_9ACAR|nr:unnamed protein product [Oppiella nova]CAG2155655.1 unnamed protein product [Oppiella nova]
MGGTFGCIGEPLAPMPDAEFIPQLKKVLAPQFKIECFKAPSIKDSSACTAIDWLMLIQQIQSLQLQNFQHFVIIHGTDTLSYAAATLSRFLAESCHVVLTGSQYPLLNIQGDNTREFTDALDNLNTALDAVTRLPVGVYLAFYHQVIHARTTLKAHSTALDAFKGLKAEQQIAVDHSVIQVQLSHIEKAKSLNIVNWMMVPTEILQFERWQTQQPGVRSIQETMENVLSKIADEPIILHGAGRTDAGVHATNMVAHFDTNAIRPIRGWLMGSNSQLPKDISIQWIKEMDNDFHARFKAKARRYRYVVYQSANRPALLHKQVTHAYYPLDVDKMIEAAQKFQGTHNFESFRAAACQSNQPVRHVKHCRLIRHGNYLVLDIQADGFLHHMVRNIMGCLLEIGQVSWLSDNDNQKEFAENWYWLPKAVYVNDVGTTINTIILTIRSAIGKIKIDVNRFKSSFSDKFKEALLTIG